MKARGLAWGLALVGWLTAGCAASATAVPVGWLTPGPDGRHVVSTADGRHVLSLTLVDGLPFNAPFEVVAQVERADGGPLAHGLTLLPSGWMPEHGHGLVRHPRAEALGGGRFRTHGWLLHMRGLWELRFDVVADQDAGLTGGANALTRATLEVRVP